MDGRGLSPGLSFMAANAVQKIGKYDVLEVLGQGGMGIVYKAVDPAIGRQVAIKMMTGGFAENPDLLRRFQREAQSAGSLQHPNIVIIYELGTHEGNPYMAMEFLGGESLESLIQKRVKMPLVEKLGIMVEILEGLHYAHSHGIIHRDVKPANVMVLKDGHVKLVDFGIARIADNSMTKTGQIVGTINYMSPEQFNGHVVDARSDVFSAGVLLYEFLTGTLPFDGNETPTVILKILNEQPAPLKEHIPNVPPDLEEAVRRALTKDREERWQTAEDFAFELSRLQDALKKDMVVEYVDLAKQAIEKKELTRAKELLQQVLKADTKHIEAQTMMRTVQQQLSVQQRGEQVRQLRQAAEDALGQKQLDEALSYAEQALKLDKDNPEIQRLHKMITQAKQRRDQVIKTLRKAEDLKAEGDLDTALKVAEEAVSIDPKDSGALTLRDVITAEIRKAQAQKELNQLLDQARSEIGNNHFTRALELIRKSENVAPGATQAASLRGVLATAREQEALRLAADTAATEAEVALYREPMGFAQQKIDDAARKYGEEPAVADLVKNAKTWREAAGLGDVKKVTARVRDLMQAERFEPAIAMLEHAIKAAPDESLKTLLDEAKGGFEAAARKAASVGAEAEALLKASKVDEAVALLEDLPVSFARYPAYVTVLARARAEQEKINAIEVQALEARKLAEKGDVTGAFNKARLLAQAHPSSGLVVQLMKDIETKRAQVAREAVEKAIKDARALINARQASAANRTLQTVAPLVTFAPPELKKTYADLQKEVAATSQQAMNADMNATMIAGSAGRGSGSGTMIAEAQTQAQKTIVTAPPVVEAKPFPVKMVAIAVAALVVLVGGFLGYQRLTAPPPIAAYAEINAIPWATVVSVDSVDGKRHYLIQQETPVRVPLPEGEYTVTFKGPDGQEVTQKLDPVTPGSAPVMMHGFQQVDANEIVKSSN
jgi:tetratricopeptide (TPR) repeat protein